METIRTYPTQIAGIDKDKQAVVIVITARREDVNGNALPLTPSQKENARAAAQAALEITDGTVCDGTSTAILLPEQAADENLTLKIDLALTRNSSNHEQDGDQEQ